MVHIRACEWGICDYYKMKTFWKYKLRVYTELLTIKNGTQI